MDWSVNSIQYLALKEVHGTFLECFLNTAANFVKKNDGKFRFNSNFIATSHHRFYPITFDESK
jgi:hypothetical protein